MLIRVRVLNNDMGYDLQEAAMNTINKSVVDSKKLTPELFNKYLVSEHSPIRSIIIRISMIDISYYTSVHFARHVHALHYVSTNRPDRVKKARSVDDTVNHIMDCNLQSLIDMSRKRLCYKSHPETVKVMQAIVKALHDSEDEYLYALSCHLEPNCLYRGFCPEFKSCGFLERYKNGVRQEETARQDGRDH